MNYEEAYKDAVSKIKSIIADKKKQGLTNCLFEGDLNEIFPELTVSEDERIRKQLLDWFKGCHWDTIDNGTLKRNDIIAWLEKQGEFANFRNKIQIGDNVTRNQAGALVNLSQLERVAKPREKQCEQEPAWSREDEHRCEDTIYFLDTAKKHYADTSEIEKAIDWLKSLKDRVQPQQKQEWSDEDEYQINTILHGLDLKKEIYKKEGNKAEEKRYNTQYNWLKSIKEKVQSKQEWSEEDKDAIGMAIEALEDLCDVDCPTDSFIGHNLSFYEAVERLKGLKPQPHWKPTEKQLDALLNYVNYSPKENFSELNALYEELVKL